MHICVPLVHAVHPPSTRHVYWFLHCAFKRMVIYLIAGIRDIAVARKPRRDGEVHRVPLSGRYEHIPVHQRPHFVRGLPCACAGWGWGKVPYLQVRIRASLPVVYARFKFSWNMLMANQKRMMVLSLWYCWLLPIAYVRGSISSNSERFNKPGAANTPYN